MKLNKNKMILLFNIANFSLSILFLTTLIINFIIRNLRVDWFSRNVRGFRNQLFFFKRWAISS